MPLHYTPWWHAGYVEDNFALLGEERAAKMFRCKTVWDSGALVTWSSDNIVFGSFDEWNPCLGMEVGMTRMASGRTKLPEHQRTPAPFPPLEERMGVEEMLLGYTINGARQLGVDKPLIMNTGDGHSMLLNTKALEWAGIDKEYALEHGFDEVHVDEDGEPDGYICEGPVFEIVPKLPKTLEDAKRYLLVWQDMALRNGYTAVADAGVEIAYPGTTQAPGASHGLDRVRQARQHDGVRLRLPAR